MKSTIAIFAALFTLSTNAAQITLSDIVQFHQQEVTNDQMELEYKLSEGQFENTDPNEFISFQNHIVQNEVPTTIEHVGAIEHFEIKTTFSSDLKDASVRESIINYAVEDGWGFFCQTLVEVREKGLQGEETKEICENHVDDLLFKISEGNFDIHLIKIEGNYYGDNKAMYLFLRDANDATSNEYIKIYLDILHEI